MFASAVEAGGLITEHNKPASAYQDCIEKSEGVTAEVLNCQTTEYKKQNNCLQINDQKQIQKLDKKARLKLIRSQIERQQSVQSTCDFYNVFDGGTVYSLILKECFIDQTAERADLIKYWLD